MASIAVSEVDMDRFDTEIPQIAAEATQQAYWESLQQTGKVVELRDGFIVETSASGESFVLACLPNIPPVSITSTRFRIRK